MGVHYIRCARSTEKSADRFTVSERVTLQRLNKLGEPSLPMAAAPHLCDDWMTCVQAPTRTFSSYDELSCGLFIAINRDENACV